MNPERLTTTSLQALPQGAAISRVLAAALAAAEPAAAVRRTLRREGDTLYIGEQQHDLAAIDNIWIAAFGKAAAPMVVAAADVLGEWLTGGVVILKDGHDGQASLLPACLACYNAAHPIPDERSVAATAELTAMLAAATERDLVLTLISGGGSALLTQPVAGVSLADLQHLTALLLGCGASIDEINSLRKHLDTAKGGGLARIAYPARLAALILSDVVGNPLDVIASGPTVADASTFADALAVLTRYNLNGAVPPAILAHLQRGVGAAETVKPGDACLAKVSNLIVGSNGQAATAALAQARSEGFATLLLTTFLQGEAREVGRMFAAIGRELAHSQQPLARPACIVAGGETTVTLRGTGHGGRNQELALGAVADLAGLADLVLVTLATDGGDGPTDAAGAVVTGATMQRAAKDYSPDDMLRQNDAYHFFAPLGDLLKPGPTDTNVNDLVFLFAL